MTLKEFFLYHPPFVTFIFRWTRAGKLIWYSASVVVALTGDGGGKVLGLM